MRLGETTRRITLGLATVAVCLCAGADEGEARMGIPQDWSHRHLVYSNPDTFEEAARAGTVDQWLRNYQDPRFVVQLLRKMEARDAAQSLSKAARPRITP